MYLDYNTVWLISERQQVQYPEKPICLSLSGSCSVNKLLPPGCPWSLKPPALKCGHTLVPWRDMFKKTPPFAALCALKQQQPVPTGQVYTVRQSREKKIKSWRIFVMMAATEFTIIFIPSLLYSPRKQSQDGIQAKSQSAWTKTGSLCSKSKNAFRNSIPTTESRGWNRKSLFHTSKSCVP